MLLALSFHSGDLDRARDLLDWIVSLDPEIPNHQLLLVASSKISNEDANSMAELGRKAFKSVTAIRQQTENEGAWPVASNAMFRLACQWARASSNGHWLWLESDAAPLVPRWLDMLDHEYRSKGRPFCGTIYDQPYRHFNGVCVYPQDVARYNPYMTHATNIPWDLTRPDDTMRQAYNTPLMQRSLADPKTNTPHTFPDQASLSIIRPGVILFHGCKDGTLLDRLRETRGLFRNGHKKPTVIHKAVAAVKAVVRGKPYYHSGNLGDIIYALYAIQLHGGGDLVIGPNQNGTAPCSNPVNADQFKMLEPLIKAQPYIKATSWMPSHPGDKAIDLNKFRDQFLNPDIRNRTEIQTLCKMHCYNLGVAHLFRDNQPWLKVTDPMWSGKIIVHRSPRYRAGDFPWKALCAKYAGQMLFVGIEAEWRVFQAENNCRVSFYSCRDFLEMARVIAGGQCFVGNQSFPLSIAIGIGQRVFCEVFVPSPDCVFDRPTFIDQRKSTILDFENFLSGSSMSAEPKSGNLITIRRSKSLGDVLAATCVASALVEKGFQVHWQAIPLMFPILRRHPDIKSFGEPKGDPDVNLDGAYEEHPDRKTKHFAELFTERANEQLAERGIKIERVINFAPRIKSDPVMKRKALAQLQRYPKPWVMICPRSYHFANRTVPNDIWRDAAAEIQGTKFWLGADSPLKGIVDLECRQTETLIEYLACSDLLVTTDTGPMHIAAALGIPVVAIKQQSDPEHHLSDQRDFCVIEPEEVPCLGCCEERCPIDPVKPPCQRIDPKTISGAVNARLRSVTSDDVSAVICIYKPKPDMIKRCLECVLPQVNEVIVCGDLDTPVMQCWLKREASDPKIKFVLLNKTESGYGRKLNYGMRHSNGRFCLALNDDVYLEPGVVEKLAKVMRSDSKVGAVTHTLLYPNNTIQFAGLGRPAGHIGFGHRSHRAPAHLLNSAEAIENESICGASVLFRRKAFYDAGASDEAFHLYSEDAALGLQIRRAGYKIIFEPHAKGIHLEHQSTGTMGDISPLLEASHKIFNERWEPYFKHNTDTTKLGNFDYLK